MKNAMIILATCTSTHVFYEGKVYGDGIEEFNYSHVAPGEPVVKITTDRLPIVGKEDVDIFKKAIDQILRDTQRQSDDLEGQVPLEQENRESARGENGEVWRR